MFALCIFLIFIWSVNNSLSHSVAGSGLVIFHACTAIVLAQSNQLLSRSTCPLYHLSVLLLRAVDILSVKKPVYFIFGPGSAMHDFFLLQETAETARDPR